MCHLRRWRQPGGSRPKARSEPSAGPGRRPVPVGVLEDQLARLPGIVGVLRTWDLQGPSWAKGMLVPFAGRMQVAAPVLGLCPWTQIPQGPSATAS